MKIKKVLVMLGVFMLSGCFFSEDSSPEKEAEKVKQSDIRTAKVVGSVECIKGQYVYFDDKVLSFNAWNSNIDFIDKDGTLHTDSINNCSFTANKGTAPRNVSNSNLYQY